MIRVKNAKVVSFSRQYLDIVWEIDPTNEDIQEYEFYILRSEAEAGPYTQIAGPLIDRYFIRDNSVYLISTTRVYFYKIKVLHKPSGREIEIGPLDRGGEEDLIALEIIRQEQIYFKEFAGTKFWLFPRRTFGMRCPQCYNAILGKRDQDSCPTCWKTTFALGYHFPVEFWGQLDEAEDAEQVSVEDHRQQKYFVIRCGPSPDTKPLDIIIDHLNRRHRIISKGGTSKHGVRVRQELRVVQIQPGSIEDTIPLKIDHLTETFFPPRNFTNPHNLEDARTTAAGQTLDYADIMGLYKY
jgi:hypothetical protein